MLNWILYLLAAYIIGSIPFGLLLSRSFAGIDIRKRGSGNIGATNVSRELGIHWGIITLCLDAFKGFLPVFFISRVFPEFETLIVLTGLFAILGHLFPVFLKFRGGKGVATAIGVYLALAPFPLLIALVIFVITVLIWDFISLGSIVFSISIPLLLVALKYNGITIIGSCIITILVCLQHRDNIRRLIKGEENRWRKRSLLQ